MCCNESSVSLQNHPDRKPRSLIVSTGKAVRHARLYHSESFFDLFSSSQRKTLQTIIVCLRDCVRRVKEHQKLLVVKTHSTRFFDAGNTILRWVSSRASGECEFNAGSSTTSRLFTFFILTTRLSKVKGIFSEKRSRGCRLENVQFQIHGARKRGCDGSLDREQFVLHAHWSTFDWNRRKCKWGSRNKVTVEECASVVNLCLA